MIDVALMSPEFGLKSLLTLLVVIDPAGLIPAFVSLAGSRSTAIQRAIARRAVLIAGLVLLAFALVGGPLLEYLGISLGSLQVAGGVLLFLIAVDMVFAQLRRETPEEAVEAMSRPDISVFPLAIPLIAGPGALASMLILTSEARGQLAANAIVFASAIVVLVVCYAFLRIARTMAGLLGQTGINVVTRVLGLLLAALAVQYVADGLIALRLLGGAG
jgi:multiple antibiotic resistance protein